MGANDDREMLVAAKAECVRLERENATLRADLDARFEHSDHQSAKYYRRMRDAERRGGELREQLAEARSEIERRPEPAFRDALIADRNKAESALAEGGNDILAVDPGFAYATEEQIEADKKWIKWQRP
jgi:hypothetical protein